jgi:hypothetical protein
MGNQFLTVEKRERWLGKIFFGVSKTPNHNINPYEDTFEFMEASIGSLQWGQDVNHSKKEFAWRYVQILDLYDIKLNETLVLEILGNDKLRNIDAVKQWSEIAQFG